MNYIGVDLGTSAVKLLLMTGEGEILKIVSKEYPVYSPRTAGANSLRSIGMRRPLKVSRNSWMLRTTEQ